MASKLMHRSPYKVEDQLETLLSEAFTALQSQLKPPYELTLQSPQEYSRLIQALLYGILTQPQAGQTYVTHLKAIVTDGYAALVNLLIRLVNESYMKLLEQTRTQIIWIFRQLVELFAVDADVLCLSLLRRIVGGDLTQGGVWLALELVHVLQSNWGWVTANPGLLTGALFTYLRLLPDHYRSKSPLLNALKKNETEFCIRVLRERFQECLTIGRDLVRLLQNVVCIPDFELIWKDLLSNPGAFRVPGFTDISQLYFTRTPVRYLISRITPEMESQIRFLLTYVKWGNQRRYQAWFANKFFCSPESETLICDLIRFICCVHHPSNDILQSDVISRWAIVGWLLKCCRSNHVEANAKLALFYDWLFFRIKIDNIMNIEPAILLMVHSIPKYIEITQSLLDFLFLLMDHYDTDRKELLQRGICASFEILIAKGVVRSLEALSSCNLIAPSLREKLMTCYPAHFSKPDHTIAGRVAKTVEFGSPPEDRTMPAVIGGQTSLQNSVPPVYPTGNHLPVGESMANDSHGMKLDAAGDAPQKRRRISVSYETCLNSLMEILNRSHEQALGMLEKILMSFLGVSDLVPDNVIGGDMLSDVLHDSSPETAVKMARQIAEIFKPTGHGMFTPLKHAPDLPEEEEIMSATALVLRMYILFRHTTLREMLLFWYNNGFAVGPRLLCYASRLADELEQISVSNHTIENNSSSQNMKGGMLGFNELDVLSVDASRLVDTLEQISVSNHTIQYNSSSQNMKGGMLGFNDLGVISADAMEESGELLENNKDVIIGRKHKLLRKSLLQWHAEKYSLCVSARGGSCSDIQHTKSMDINHVHKMVEDAFTAYKDFLMFTGTTMPMHQTVNSSPIKNSFLKRSDGFSPKGIKDTDQNAAVVFLADLRTCCLWSASRSLQVLKSIFCYLSDFSTGREDVIHLLVCLLVPADLLKFEIKLGLKDFSVFGEDPQTLCSLIKCSLDWDFTEQQIFWQLLISELQVSAVPLAMTLLSFCAEALNPLVHVGAVAGLLMFLRSQCPSAELVNAILHLPKRFANFAASVIACWSVSNTATLFRCLTDWTKFHLSSIQRTNTVTDNTSCSQKFNGAAIIAFINFLDRHKSNQNVGSKCLQFADVLEIRASLLELADSFGF
eukprot:Gb_23780 [translate_table: standard]